MTTPRDPDEILAAVAGRGAHPAPRPDPPRDRRRHPDDHPTTARPGACRGGSHPWSPLARPRIGRSSVLARRSSAPPSSSHPAARSYPPRSAAHRRHRRLQSIDRTRRQPDASSLVPTLPVALGLPFIAVLPVRRFHTAAYPADWTVQPSQRDWTYAADASDPVSPAHDAFLSPGGDVRVSVWSIPFALGKSVDTLDFEAWVETYCEQTGNTPCREIHDRAVTLCIERRDCHPGLLVPFDDDVQAFLSGGIFPGSQMTVVSVWRGESDPSVVPYGGSRHLLEAFLSTMGAWPNSLPLQERVVRDVPVTPPS